MSGRLTVGVDGRQTVAWRVLVRMPLIFLVNAGTVTNTDGSRRCRRQRDAGGEAVTPAVAREFRVTNARGVVNPYQGRGDAKLTP